MVDKKADENKAIINYVAEKIDEKQEQGKNHPQLIVLKIIQIYQNLLKPFSTPT